MDLSELRVLFVGAHHDDIELGAGALLSALASLDAKVSAIILTDDLKGQIAKKRRAESYAALEKLGLEAAYIHFAGFPDGDLQVGRYSVARLRSIIQNCRARDPHIVVTHSTADSHNDHVIASQLVTASVRKSAILGFPILNSLILNRFHSAYSRDLVFPEAYLAAILCHNSQIAVGRINVDAVLKFKCNESGGEHFDLTVQYDSDRGALETLVTEGILRQRVAGGWYVSAADEERIDS